MQVLPVEPAIPHILEIKINPNTQSVLLSKLRRRSFNSLRKKQKQTRFIWDVFICNFIWVKLRSFPSILNHMEFYFHLVAIFHYHIPFNLKGNVNMFFTSNSFNSIYRSFHIFNCRQFFRTSGYYINISIRVNIAYILHAALYSIFTHYMRTVQLIY